MGMNAQGGGSADHLRRAIVIWVVVSIVAILAILGVPHVMQGLPPAVDYHSKDANLTIVVFTILAAPVWAMVMAFAWVSLTRHRTHDRVPGVAAPEDGPALRATGPVQFWWVALSLVLVCALYGWGLVYLDRADAAPAPGSDVLQVYVTGEQWNWNFTYPQYGYAQSEQLELPVNRPVLFTITSIDVTHSFSVPAFGIKEDAVPGDWTYIRATPDKIGDYVVRCYELCGMFHSYMEEPVHVVNTDQFASWVTAQPVGYPWGMYGVSAPGNYTAPTLPGAPTPVVPVG